MAAAAAKKDLNIYQKLAEIRKEIPTLQKNGELSLGSGKGYKFLAVDDVLVAVKPVEEKYGVIVVLEDSEIQYHYNTAIAKEDGRAPAEKVQATGYFTFRAINTEAADPKADSYPFVVPSEGGDTADKSTRKTVTQAQKIAYITLYNLITGEPDPDGSEGANAPEAAEKPVPQAVAKAQAASKPAPATKGSTEAPAAAPATPRRASESPLKAQIRKEWVDTGKVTAARVTEIAKSVPNGFDSDEDKWKYVLKTLETGGA